MHRAVTVRSTPVEIQCSAREIQQLTQYWHRQKGMFRRYPLMDDIAPRELAPYAEDICILDYTARPPSLVFRRVGSAVAGRLGVDPTGHDVDALRPDSYRRAARCALDDALRYGRPVAHEITVAADGESMAMQQLVLPLSLTGVEIDFLLTYSKALAWDPKVLGRAAVEPEPAH